jgi:hypothetical protein
MWGIAINAVRSLGSDWMSNRKAKSEAKLTKDLAIISGERAADAASASDMATSLKDEFLTLVLTAPLIVVFYAAVWGDPEMINQVTLAFEVMSALPEWYQFCFMGCVAATFGLRSVKALGPKS